MWKRGTTLILKQKETVKFDPKSQAHLIAFADLRVTGKQSPNYRFELEQPYNNVVTMMNQKIIDTFLEEKLC